MGSTTVRIDRQTHQALKELAASTGNSMREVLALATESYRRQLFLEKLAEEFAALRADEETWEEELTERREWETTLGDGLRDT